MPRCSIAARRAASFDHLVGDREHRGRHLDAERARSLQIDDELEFGQLSNWEVGGLRALEDAAGIDADLLKHVHEVGSVAHQPTGFDKVTDAISRRNFVARRQSDKLPAAAGEECVWGDEEGLDVIARHGGEGRVYLAAGRRVENLESQSDGGGGLLYFP